MGNIGGTGNYEKDLFDNNESLQELSDGQEISLAMEDHQNESARDRPISSYDIKLLENKQNSYNLFSYLEDQKRLS